MSRLVDYLKMWRRSTPERGSIGQLLCESITENEEAEARGVIAAKTIPLEERRRIWNEWYELAQHDPAISFGKIYRRMAELGLVGDEEIDR